MSETTVYTDFRLHAHHVAETGERSPAEVAVRRDLAAAYQLCALFGWDDLVYTHISARVPGTDHHFLVNPLGLGFDEITASSLIKIDTGGNVIGDSGGYEPNAAGFVIHGAIHSTRENAGCATHLHTEAQMALSTLTDGLLPLTQHAMRLYGRISYHDYEGIALSEGERERLVADLGGSAAMVLRNHGSLTVGASVAQAFVEMFYLEKAARSQLLAQATGQALIIPARETIELTARQWDGMLDAGIEWPRRAGRRPAGPPSPSDQPGAMTFAQRWETAVRTSGDRLFLVFEGPEPVRLAVDLPAVRRGCHPDGRDLGGGRGDGRVAGSRGAAQLPGVHRDLARLRAVGRVAGAGRPDVHRPRHRPAVDRVRRRPGSARRAARTSTRRGCGSPPPAVAVIELTETAADVAPAADLAGSSADAAVAPADRLAVMFTSGTTSEPKGVVLTQHNYAHVADTMSAVVGLRPEHRWLVTLPLFHANAQYYCIAPAIAVGASVALTSTFSASQWLRQARDLAATHASLFAAPIRMILARRPADAPAGRLEHVWFAQNLGRQHYDEFAALAGCRPRQLYGMTETVAIVCADVSEPYRNDTIGPPVEGRSVVLTDPETGADAPPGEPGELVLAGVPGEDIFLGYLDDPAATGRSLTQRDGITWFRTGDMVTRVADDGALRFVGRRDDVIKVSGENVSLTEVEATLAQAPGVLECAVLAGGPGRDMVPVAYVVPRDRSIRRPSASWPNGRSATWRRPRARATGT